MPEDAATGAAPGVLSREAVATFDDLDETELRAAIDYLQSRLQAVHPDLAERLRSRPDEEILSVSEDEGVTTVVRRQPCAEGCPDCPHGPYLYRVRETPRPNGDSRLDWTYLGPVETGDEE